MDRYRVRREGSEVWAGTLDELHVLHADGRIRQGDEVWEGTRWVPASEVPSLRPRRAADPFAAWDDADSVDAAAVLDRVVRRTGAVAVTGPDVRPPAILGPATERRRALPPAVVAGVPPIEDERTDSGGATGPPPGLRAVPPPGRPGSSGRPALAPPPAEPEARPSPARDPLPQQSADGAVVIDFPAFPGPPSVWRPEVAVPRPTPAIRPARLALYVAAGVAVLGLWAGWVRLNADSRFGVTEVTEPATPSAGAPAERLERQGGLAEVEASLRAGVGGSLRPIRQPGDLSDALLIDLANLKVDVETAEAEITEWSGRFLDEPRKGRVRVTLRTAQELDRSLGAVALVVGRYAQEYRLELDPIEVRVRTSDGDRRTILDPRRAAAFYTRELGLEELLRVP